MFNNIKSLPHTGEAGGAGEAGAVASEARGQRGQLTPHFLEHGVKRGQGHQISDNWIDGSYSILADIALAKK